jgi:ERCC4-type nuclease
MMLTIDSRERKGSKLVDLVIEKADSLGIPNEKKWIEVGDYVFDDVCFEAKSCLDFIQSVLNKRIWTQIDNMDRHYKHNIVIIYGDLEANIDSLVSHSKHTGFAFSRHNLRRRFLGAIGRITLDTDTRAFWVPSEKEASLIITTICKMKPIERPSLNPQLIKRIATDDMRVDVLTSIKGISVKKAKALLKKFGSVVEISYAKLSEIKAVEGFGTTLAERVLEVLNTEDKVTI